MNATKPVQIVILGGSGDLSRRKLLPALIDLYCRNKLPEQFRIVGLARTPRSDGEYRAFVKESIENHQTAHDHFDQEVADFCSHISYVSGSFDDAASYKKLETALAAYDAEQGITSNRLFYLAVPPRYYEQIFEDLHVLCTDCQADTDAWTHVLVEKPFGNDLSTAQALDAKLSSLYDESQIFRIDHYLAKEAVQNILSFRFANTLLRAPWNKDGIKSVEIEMKETIDVEHRAGFYEDVGALRDVGQNHLLQLLALVAMREPESLEADAIRLKRAEVLEALRPINPDTLEEQVVRAQYEDYVCHDQTDDQSQTETYFELKTFVDLPEWHNVPFIIKAGKAFDESRVAITINFYDVSTGPFETKTCSSVGNKITLTISPQQTLALTLNAKQPGLGYQLEPRTLDFCCVTDEAEIKNSYEKILHDAIIGDQSLFTRTEEVLAAWKFITPILEHWDAVPLYTYKKGSGGPEQHIMYEL